MSQGKGTTLRQLNVFLTGTRQLLVTQKGSVGFPQKK
jgi:hypothetical protein